MTTSLFSLISLLSVLQVSGAPSNRTAAGMPSAPAVAASSGTSSLPGSVGAGGSSAAGGTSGLSSPAPGQPITLTLDQVVNIAVNSNTNVVLAKQRYKEAVEGVNQINAQGQPQLGSNVADTYSSYAASTASFGPVVSNPVVPTGTTIPTVTDAAADFSSTFGIGTAASGVSYGAAYGQPVGGTGSEATLPAANSAVPGSTSSTSLPGLDTGTGVVTGAPGAGTTSSSGSSVNEPTAGSTPATALPPPPTAPPSSTTTPDTGAGSTAPGSTGTTAAPSSDAAPAPSATSFNLMPMPLILQNYVTEASAPAVVTGDAQTADDQRSSSTKSDAAAVSASKNALAEKPDQATTTTDQTVTASNDTVNNYGARISLSQYIDAFGLLGAARDAEKLNRDFYALDIDRNQNEVALSAKNLFFNVVLAEQEVATEQEQVTDSTESVRVTAALVQQGQAAGFDLLSVQTTLANNQQLLTSAQNQLSFAVADLDYLLGINPDTPIRLTPPSLPPLDQTVDLAQSTSVALQRRPEIIQANKNIAMAQKLVKVASEGTTPTLGLVGTYGYNSTATITGPSNEGLLSAQIQIPFYDGGATRSRVREAKDVLQSETTTRDELKLSVALEVRQAYLNVIDGQTQARSAQSGVALAEETLRVANVQYTNGVGTILDVENAQAQLATARTNLADAQYTYQTALASLVRAIGSR